MSRRMRISWAAVAALAAVVVPLRVMEIHAAHQEATQRPEATLVAGRR